jgi:hypothetical protein
VLLIFSVLVMLSYPFTVGRSPASGSSRHEVAEFAVRMILFIVVAVLAWLATGISAYVLFRRIRSEYEDEVVKNLTTLVAPKAEKRSDADSN